MPLYKISIRWLTFAGKPRRNEKNLFFVQFLLKSIFVENSVMFDKVKKLLSFLKIITSEPSLINHILNLNTVQKNKFIQKYGNFLALPQVEIKDLTQKPVSSIESFLLDGSSLITDLQLLVSLAGRNEIHSYLEIGTWRGESVYNVAKEVEDCTTINLSVADMRKLGWNINYAEQHAILSKKNPNILHLEANTKTFDFGSLNKKYDLIFIDGDHSYDMVLSDTRNVFKHLVHENTVVVWHDYAYSAQKIRYEVFQAILDGVDPENHKFLYHPKNTMCAVFMKDKLQATAFDEFAMPDKIYNVSLSEVISFNKEIR